ncbi:MAG: hypothetical protein VKI81_09450 [Synechococcaceae cyanobacterium]|nr:hypothetical protein [Synechococcaceae cyanobacterium]
MRTTLRRLSPLLSFTASLLILVVGWNRIENKVRERPTIAEDSILTSDELANLPPGTLAAVLPQTPGSGPESLGYRILELSLRRSGRPFALGYGSGLTDQEASIQRLEAGPEVSRSNPNGLTVGMFGVGREIHDRLRPIPVPVAGGLLGLRAFWVNRNRADRFRSVVDRQDLDGTVAVQGIGWSDAQILVASGLRTYTTEPSLILDLLSQDRVDFYPKGISELEQDHRLIGRDYPMVELEENLLLAYPFALMYYVHPDNAALAEAIRTGLERAIADGSHRRLLQRHVFTPWLRRKLRLPQRRVISLPNRDDEALLAEVDPRHWLIPWRDFAAGGISRGEQLCATGALEELCDGR